MESKKKLIGIVIVAILMGVVVFLIGRTFGFFRYVKEGEIINVVAINGIEVEILNDDGEKAVLNLENAHPMYDNERETLTPFVFKVTNTTSKDLTYKIKIVSDQEKLDSCTLEDGSPCQELSTDNIRFVYQKDEDGYTNPENLGEKENIVATEIIPAKESLTHSIILWIKNDAENDTMGKYFYSKIILEGVEIK